MTPPGLGVQAVRARRSLKHRVDPLEPQAVEWEKERGNTGLVPALTVLLTGAECPFTCVFCDLWRNTLDHPTPVGAIPTQLRRAMALAGPIPAWSTIKLYNASNFFDQRAVPAEDDEAIAAHVGPFERVVVECHPSFIDERCHRFADMIEGQLEVAIGLETIHPQALPHLNKGATLDDFDRVCADLMDHAIDIRAFVLLGAPFVPPDDSVDSVVASVAYAVRRGARHVSIIPTRGGNGALEELATRSEWHPPTLSQLEAALALSIESDAIVTVDLWDADRFAGCDCGGARIARLDRMNLTGQSQPPVPCDVCGGSDDP